MKDFLFKLSLVFLIAFGAYTTITTVEKRQAGAFCACTPGCISPGLCMCPYDVGTNVSLFSSNAASTAAQQMQSAQEMAENFVETKQKESDANLETAVALSAENRAADVEKARQQAVIEEARASEKQRMKEQEMQFENLQESPAPSDQVCFHTTMRQQQTLTEATKKHAQAERYERRRIRRGKISHTVKATVIKKEVKNNPLLIEEVASLRSCSGCTITPEDEAKMDLLNVATSETVPPTSTADLQNNKFIILQDAKNMAFANLDNALTDKLEAQKQAPDTSDCEQAQNIVYKISLEVYGDPYKKLPAGVCPSQETLRWAEIAKARNTTDIEETLTDDQGNAKSHRINAEIVSLMMKYDELELERLKLLQKSARLLRER